MLSFAMVGALVAPAVWNVQPAHAAIAPGSVVINEIMYNYASGSNVAEWVELYNTTGSAIDLSGYKVTDNGVGSTSLTEGVFTLPTGTKIPANGYLTIGNSYSTASVKWTSANLALGNSGDGFALFYDTNGDNLATSSEVIDTVEFTSSWGGNGNGTSLERKDPAGTSQSSTNWASSTANGGTPGAKNTVAGGSGGGGGDTGGNGSGSGLKVLWDQGHGQTAGNADWTINGANSDFADGLRAKGFTVASTTATITASVLSGYKVLVLPEPNVNYTSAEKTAINTFIQNGGGVYFIADHITSDRNNDGWDSVQIFDGSQTQANPSTGSWVGATFGFYFNRNNVSQEPITDIRANSVTSGVKSVGAWNGSTLHLTGANSTIVSDIFLTSQADPFHIHGKYGSGRFAALGDSSLYDDGTGASGKTLYDGWNNYSDKVLGINTVLWLAGSIN